MLIFPYFFPSAKLLVKKKVTFFSRVYNNIVLVELLYLYVFTVVTTAEVTFNYRKLSWVPNGTHDFFCGVQ